MNGELAYTAELRGERLAPPDDRARFEQLLDRHDRRLRRFVAGIVADRHRCDDVLQEAYLKAYRRLPARFAGEAQETAWLYRVVYRCCLDELRRARRTTHEELHDVHAPPGDVDRSLALDRALRALRPSDRAVIFLVGVAGLEHREAAAVLGIPRGTVSWRLSVARTRFRELLAAEGIADA
jgi:RNA polymerase sigma-70 factor, ECF subfamily